MKATRRRINDVQSHVNILIESYLRDMNVLRTHFMSSHYRTNKGQPSSSHENMNEGDALFDKNNAQQSLAYSNGQRTSVEGGIGCTNERVSKIPHLEECVFFANKDHLHPRTHNMLMSVQSCGDNNKDVKPQALEEIRPRRVKIKACHHRQRAVVCKSLFIQFCVSKYKRLNEEETYIANYVFDDSKNPRSVPNHKFIKHCSYNAMIKIKNKNSHGLCFM